MLLKTISVRFHDKFFIFFFLLVPLHGDCTAFTRLGPTNISTFIETSIIYTKKKVDKTTPPYPDILAPYAHNNRR